MKSFFHGKILLETFYSLGLRSLKFRTVKLCYTEFIIIALLVVLMVQNNTHCPK